MAGIVLTKDTMEKLKKGLSNREKSRLLFERLEEAYDSGKLIYAKTRYDVAELCGFTNRKRGYTWVSKAVKDGKLIERFEEVGANGFAIYSYYLPSKVEPQVEVKQTEEVEQVEQVEEVKKNDITMTIEQGETTIKIENAERDTIVEIIKNIIK